MHFFHCITKIVQRFIPIKIYHAKENDKNNILKTVVKHNIRLDNNQCMQMKYFFLEMKYSKLTKEPFCRLLNDLSTNDILSDIYVLKYVIFYL